MGRRRNEIEFIMARSMTEAREKKLRKMKKESKRCRDRRKKIELKNKLIKKELNKCY